MAEEPFEEQPEGPPPEESQNRTFVLLALGLGGLFVVGLIFIGVYAFLIAPRIGGASNATRTAIAAANAAAAQALTATAGFVPPSDTPLPQPTAEGALATETPLIPPTATDTQPPTNTGLPGTPSSTPQPLRTRTPTPSRVGTGGGTGLITPLPTALPTTGFADEVGAPALVLIGLGLIAAIIVARRLRLGRA